MQTAVNINVDMTKVKTNDDGSVIVGDENATITVNGNLLLELLTKED